MHPALLIGAALVTATAAVGGLVPSIPHLVGRASGAPPEARDMAPAKALPVVLEPAARRDVPISLQAIGSVQAYNKVTIRPMVDGRIDAILFSEGQEVKAGSVLVRLDPRPFEANLRHLEAARQRDRVQLATARADLARYADLASRQIASRQTLENQAAAVAQLEAQVQSDDAQIDAAKLDLEHATVRAPIDGRIGMRLVDPGNAVRALDPSGLAVITQIRPIAVVFTLPQDQLGAVRQAMRQGPLPVTAFARGDRTPLAHGTLTAIENSIDPQNGTFRLKARIDNEAEELWPGQFVTVTLQTGMASGALVIPAAAIQRGPQGAYVYVARPDGVAELRHIRIGAGHGERALVESGLAEGESVVVEGQHRLQPGSRLAPQPAPPAASTAVTAAALPGRP